jgi:acetylornithine deacetylase/succinyl-diaminopimelate desuccinylase-like protein
VAEAAGDDPRGRLDPVMATFQQVFNLPSIMMGFGLDDDNVHAPNEKISLSSYHGGTRSVAYLYEELAQAK